MISAPTAPSRIAPTQKGEARRLRLLEAAADAFLAQGFAEASIQTIVRHAGGSVTTAYQLFGSKEGLLMAVLQDELAKMQDEVFPESLFDQPAIQALPAIAERLLAYAVRPRSISLYRLLISECHRLPQLADYLRQQSEVQIYSPLERYLRIACDRNELLIDAPRQAAFMLGSLINGITHEARVVGGYPDGPTAHDLSVCRFSIAAFLRAFTPAKAS